MHGFRTTCPRTRKLRCIVAKNMHYITENNDGNVYPSDFQEKWDSMTRKWKDNRSLVQAVRLFLIDEVMRP